MQAVIGELHKNGQRFTRQRECILTTLKHTPLSVTEVSSLLASGGIKIDKATLYRTLDCFVEMGLVGKTQFKDKSAKFELLDKDNHHHHLICDNCGSIEDIPLNEKSLLKEVSHKTDFIIKSHSLEFYGLCKICQK